MRKLTFEFIKHGFFVVHTGSEFSPVEIQRVDDALGLSLEENIYVPQLKSDLEAVKIAKSIGFIMSASNPLRPVARLKIKKSGTLL